MFHESLPFQFIIHFFKQISSSKVFFFLSVQIQGTEVEDSIYVEFKKVKLEMILKVEVHKIFVLCSKEVMQQNLGKNKRSSKGVLFCVVR
jgi:hypothetical protein